MVRLKFKMLLESFFSLFVSKEKINLLKKESIENIKKANKNYKNTKKQIDKQNYKYSGKRRYQKA